MQRYKYFTPEMVDAEVREVERILDEQKQKELEDARLARLRDYMNNPANKQTIENDPLVRAIRSLPERTQGSTPARAVPAVQPAPAPAAPAPSAYKSRAQLERERPWLAPRKPEVESVIDPYAGRKTNRIRIG